MSHYFPDFQYRNDTDQSAEVIVASCLWYQCCWSYFGYQGTITWFLFLQCVCILVFNNLELAILYEQHMWPLLKAGGGCGTGREFAVVANLSARVGSIGDNALGGWHSYRASKAALNQCMIQKHLFIKFFSIEIHSCLWMLKLELFSSTLSNKKHTKLLAQLCFNISGVMVVFYWVNLTFKHLNMFMHSSLS